MNTLYISIAKKVDHTIFNVADGQKTYWDPTFNKRLPYSSGQQVKRCIIEEIANSGNFQLAPTTFESVVSKKKGKTEVSEGAVSTPCDPTYVDQLLGGWMNINKSSNIKRRSPLSISAMRPIHPLLAGVNETTGTFDRRDRNNNVVVFKEGDNILDEEAVDQLLEEFSSRSFTSKFLQEQRSATGIFIFDVAIDLNRLFSVKFSKIDSELTEEVKDKLLEQGWEQKDDQLILPKEKREMLIPHIVDGILNWRITSNQSRNFSMMEILAVATSTNVHEVSGAIRAELDQEEHAQLILSDDAFITESAAAYSNSFNASPTAINDAKSKIIELLSKHNPAQEKVTL
ncbi:CRISPR-associated protein Cas7 (plasmid) [Flammeovirga sp. MY04]|uniref:hypothetical protein n=1 Tax=Flammeovirga sp. MY04 TaxID=1191459 RepID=UPI000825BEB3|nr:hypothetical protein [Flammeovirga sp. MY04]ANQ52933.2 CRISPR-associated protein Cas7 [Flammeovirga sp. MY04]